MRIPVISSAHKCKNLIIIPRKINYTQKKDIYKYISKVIKINETKKYISKPHLSPYMYKVHKGIMSHLSMEYNYELKEGH